LLLLLGFGSDAKGRSGAATSSSIAVRFPSEGELRAPRRGAIEHGAMHGDYRQASGAERGSDRAREGGGERERGAARSGGRERSREKPRRNSDIFRQTQNHSFLFFFEEERGVGDSSFGSISISVSLSYQRSHIGASSGSAAGESKRQGERAAGRKRKKKRRGKKSKSIPSNVLLFDSRERARAAAALLRAAHARGAPAEADLGGKLMRRETDRENE